MSINLDTNAILNSCVSKRANIRHANVDQNNVSYSNDSISRRSADLQRVQKYTYPPQLSAYARANLTTSATCINSNSSDDRTIMSVRPTASRKAQTRESAQSFCGQVKESPIKSKLLDPLPSNVLVGMAATDGIGLSTLLSLLAYHIGEEGLHVAIVDADLTHGGLDVLLGLESDEGRRLHEVDAPLGRCDGHVLCSELLHWDNVDVLSFSPWLGKQPDPWVVEAAIRGLAEACDVVIVDIGAGESAIQAYKRIPQLSNVATVSAVELSVMDLARFRAHSQRLNAMQNIEVFNNKFAMVGLTPRGIMTKSYILSIDEAEEYLRTPIFASLPYDSRLYMDIVGGYGIRNVPSSMESAMNQLERWFIGSGLRSAKKEVTRFRHSKYRDNRPSFLRGKYGRK